MDNTREKLAYLIVSDLPEKDQLANAEAADKLAEHLIANDVVPVVRCKDCKHSIWDEEEQMWECVLTVNLTGDLDTYSMFHEYNDGEHFCSYGERKDNG